MKNQTSFFIALLFISACSNKAGSPSSSGGMSTPWSISSTVLGHQLMISASPRFAGAINSLNWNGKEFINQDDHGRELQSASSFDGLGECYNPTEAGSEADGDTSTSKLLGISTSGDVLKTSTQMAFWTSVNEAYPAGCGVDTNIKVAQNTTNLSNHVLSKQVTIGFSGIANVIEYLVTFHVPEHHTSAVFESLTGYLTQDFSSFWTFDPAAGSLVSLSAGPGEQHLPIIFSTLDKQYAMGVYTPDLPQATFPDAGYGRFNFFSQNTMKWNAVFRNGDTPAGDYSFRLYLVVGSLADVTRGMTAVYKVLNP